MPGAICDLTLVVLTVCPTEPAPVTNLSVLSHSPSSLSLGWSHPEGDFDSFVVYLYRGDGSQQHNCSGGANMMSCSFSHLAPGTQYRATVLTKSGELANIKSIEVHTGLSLSHTHMLHTPES